MAQREDMLIVALSAQQPILWCWGYQGDQQWQKSGTIDITQQHNMLPSEIRQAKTLVLVPGNAVVLREVTFLGKARQATPKTLAFQLEDELLEDVEALHWVILGRTENRYALAGYRHQDMKLWQTQLQQLGLQATTMLPATLALPYENEINAIQLSGYWLIRTGKWEGVALPQHWPLSSLNLTVAAAQNDNNDQFASFLWQATTHLSAKKCNLLQGHYAKRTNWLSNKYWQSRIGVILILATLVIMALNDYQQKNRLNKQTHRLYSQLFPSEPIPKTPLAQAQKKLRLLQAHQDETHFFMLAQQAIQALAKLRQPKTETITFDADNAALTLTLSASLIRPFNYTNDEGNKVLLKPTQDSTHGELSIKENK